MVDFASNDTLGLARSKHLWTEWQASRMGATGARLMTGNHRYVEQLEHEIACYHGCEAALIVGSGYLANIALLSALGSSQTLFIHDLDVHASMYDGMRLGRARCVPFRHQDMEHLERRLRSCSGYMQRFVIVESLYSMSGCLAPLDEMISLCARYGAQLIVDEAHAVGVYGPCGRGLADGKQPFARIVTFGKALGCYGAAILGTHLLKQYLINFARPFIYSTALPFPLLAAVRSAYRLLPGLDQERKQLRKLVEIWQSEMPVASPSHIQYVPVSGNDNARALMQRCVTRGFDVRAILSPTVRRGQECLRVCLHAFNTEQQLRELVQYLRVRAF
jgi:8-amino-7-oxononanoate synthase